MLSLLVAVLYLLCFVLLGGLVLLIAFRSHRAPSPRFGRVRKTFVYLALSLLLWQFTLFLEAHTTLPRLQLYLGRSNFTAIVFVVYFALRFVQEIDRAMNLGNSSDSGNSVNHMNNKWSSHSGKLGWFLFAETFLLAIITLFTPLVDAEEWVIVGSHGIVHPITRFGPLFPVYLLHVFAYWLASIGLAFWLRRKADRPKRRWQLTLVGLGITVTGAIAAVTNAYLPYAFDDFRFCQIGTLATFFFIAAVAYAVFIHNLFDLKIVLRETLVFGLLLTFVLGAYTSTIFVVTQYLTEGAGKSAQFMVLLLAFSFDPLRRYLEKKTDHLIFGQEVSPVNEVDGGHKVFPRKKAGKLRHSSVKRRMSNR